MLIQAVGGFVHGTLGERERGSPAYEVLGGCSLVVVQVLVGALSFWQAAAREGVDSFVHHIFFAAAHWRINPSDNGGLSCGLGG
jgi:hypothetical protein